MRWGTRAISALLALACAVGAACNGGGSSDDITIETMPAFPQGFLPIELSGASGDVAFRAGGDLYAVDGTPDVTVVSRSDGSVTTFASVSAGNALRSITVGPDGRVFAGDAAGGIWAIAADGSGAPSLLVDTGNDAVTGLAFAPAGFGELGGLLFAAVGASGILRITTGESPMFEVLALGDYVDVAFSGTTLFALDATEAEIDTVDALGAPTSFQGGFGAPVGIAVDDGGAEILVADAGDDVLRALPVSGGAPSDRAPYDFDPDAPSGIAYDGIGAIAFVASGIVHGSAVPRIDPANPSFGLRFAGPTVGYGDLELLRGGAFVLVASGADDPGDPADPTDNFLFRVERDPASVTTLASAIGAAGEELLAVAVDPKTETIYIGSRLGNVHRRRSDGTISLLVGGIGAPVLGLELAPAAFGGFGGQLVATTSDGRVLRIDPSSPTPVPIASIAATSGDPAARLSDLVFSIDGTLFVLDNGQSPSPGDPRVLVVAPTGVVTDLGVNPALLGRPDGIEIDEGGDRLLVGTSTDGGDLLLEVDLADPTTPVALAAIDIDDAFFPTGIVYDRLGIAIVRQGDGFTSLRAFQIFP